MARPQRHDASAHQSLLLLRLLLLLLLPSATAAPFSTLCKSTPPPDLPVAKHSSDSAHLTLPWIDTGYFSGGDDLRFAPDSPYTRALTFSPRDGSARATSDPAVTHLSATLTLAGTRSISWGHGARPHSVSFDLNGYYSTATSTAELCMVGSGSYATEDGFGVVVLPDVVLHLHLPQPSNLSRPFLTGRLEGEDFRAIDLVAYAEDGYAYGEAASCPPPLAPVRAARQVLPTPGNYSCSRLKALLRSSYSLEYRPNGHHGASSGFPLRQRHGSMYVNQMRCEADGAVRAYMVFYANRSVRRLNYSTLWRRAFVIGDEALVADGFWDSSRSQLCLRACRVESSGQPRADVTVGECGIGVSFWFPAVWSIRERSIVTGMIWNTSGNSDAGSTAAGVVSVSRTGSYSYRGSLSGIKYNYTRVEEAKKHYDSLEALSKERKGRFPDKYSYGDLKFHFFLEKQGLAGHARPVTIGSALVEGNELMVNESFAVHGAAEENKQRLLNVSYNFKYQVAYVNQSLSATTANISPPEMLAEGVYDTKTGSLCMVACQASNGSPDCEILVTFQFAPLNSVDGELAVGTISSLRNKSDDTMFFEALDFVVHGMSVRQIEESMSRMDMESIMLVVSMTLSCVFTVLQLRHVSKHPEALPATSITMLVVLALGYVIPLVLNLKDMYTDRESGRRYILQLTTGGSLDLNELMLRVSTMLAFVLQLRLLHLALSSRRSTDQAGSKHEGSSASSDAERSTLWICLPLYVLGAVVVWIVHMSDVHYGRPRESALSALSGPALVDDLAAYAGLILDGFLLPQVISNAVSGSRVRALSPWFYAGSTVIRSAPHAYDVFRKRNYAPSWRPSSVYASPRDDLFGVAWDIAIPCGAALLAALLFLQQWLGGAFLCCAKSRRSGSGEYEMVSTLSS